ncbi:hypothetical protein HPP92_002444 [Vanilla planifolia]|uniref:Protein kinase domain-containing protein n=1 Tax=Vanilla planifolia TaxID=51239 RepID=A0A835VKL6_VANPL|nr:hypothetical protein HPP92_002444 [Vanilla planifolia]
MSIGFRRRSSPDCRVDPAEKMAKFYISDRNFLHYPLFLLLLLLLLSSAPHLATAQKLSASQWQALFRLRRVLQYPPALASWNRYTSFCSLPRSPSLSISCSLSGQITALSITGEKPHIPLANFSSDSLFSILSKLNSLTSLSLVSLGILGTIPSKVKNLSSLKVLNLSSNHFFGAIPPAISSMPNLESLVLSKNHFNGTLPDLKPLALLSELDLSENFLGPEFPSLGKRMAILELQNNHFRTKIPLDVASFDQLQMLDLSSNQFSGPIPPSLFSLPYLRYLNLSSNKFKGSLPLNLLCGVDLNFVDLSGNLLMGRLPSCIKSNSSSLIVLTSWNCFSAVDSRFQHPNSYCSVKPLAAVFPVTKNKERPKTNLGLMLSLLGGILGGVVVIGLLTFLVIGKVKSENNVVTSVYKPKSKNILVQSSPKTLCDTRQISQAVNIGTMGLTPYRVFTMEELNEATNGFNPSNLVSEGPKGQLFRGRLQDGSIVVMRSIRLKQKYSYQCLQQHIDVFSKLRHRHLVSILGHCIANGLGNTSMANHVFLLVFENVSNGTLRSHLTEWRKREMLKWPQRISAVIGVARGIQFLHTCVSPAIADIDINIDNIFLDEILTAKVSNYKLPRLHKKKKDMVSSGSPFDVEDEGDVDSIQNFTRAKKEDTYRLGLILLEVITGKPAQLQGELNSLKTQLQKSLNETPEELKLLEIRPSAHTFAYDSFRNAVQLALSCLSKDPSGVHPSMMFYGTSSTVSRFKMVGLAVRASAAVKQQNFSRHIWLCSFAKI